MANATRVAGVLEVEVDVKGNLTKMVIEDMFKRAIAAAVGLPGEFVAKVEVSEINRSAKENVSLSEANNTSNKNLSSGVRRLQAIQTKWFEVYYEIDVPSNMDADAIIERADRIAVPGSEESQLFRDILMATDGVERVGEIISTLSAYEIGATTAPSKSPFSKHCIRSGTDSMHLICLSSQELTLPPRLSRALTSLMILSLFISFRNAKRKGRKRRREEKDAETKDAEEKGHQLRS